MPKWTPEARFRLLLAVITVNNVTATDWDKVAVMMGEDYTVEAVRQAYKKVRNEVSAELNTDLEGPVTPKRSAPRPRKRKQEDGAEYDDGDARAAKKGRKGKMEFKEEGVKVEEE